MVGLEEEVIDKDFRQSYWLALQFWVQPNRIFTVGVPQASHGKRNTPATECLTKINYKTAFSQLEDGLEDNSLTTRTSQENNFFCVTLKDKSSVHITAKVWPTSIKKYSQLQNAKTNVIYIALTGLPLRNGIENS